MQGVLVVQYGCARGLGPCAAAGRSDPGWRPVLPPTLHNWIVYLNYSWGFSPQPQQAFTMYLPMYDSSQVMRWKLALCRPAGP